MKADTRRKLSMAATALDFSNANPSDQASYKTVVARLEALVSHADELSVQQRTGSVAQALAVAQRATVRLTMANEQLRQLARVAAAAAKDHPELKGMFKVPRIKVPSRIFLAQAKSNLAAATEQKPLLDSLGLGETVIDDLTASVAAYEAATADAHAGHMARVGAVADLNATVQDAVNVVGILDAINRTRFKGDPEQLAAWRSASNVKGPFKKSAEPVAPVPPAPGAGGDPSPA